MMAWQARRVRSWLGAVGTGMTRHGRRGWLVQSWKVVSVRGITWEAIHGEASRGLAWPCLAGMSNRVQARRCELRRFEAGVVCRVLARWVEARLGASGMSAGGRQCGKCPGKVRRV